MDVKVILDWIMQNWIIVCSAVTIIYYMRKNGKQIIIIAQMHEKSTNNVFRFLQENNADHRLIEHRLKDNDHAHDRFEKSLQQNAADIKSIRDKCRHHNPQPSTPNA